VEFRTSVDRLLTRIGHWDQGRWAANGRADAVYALVQRLADRAADAEGRDRRPVPRESDLILPDQLRVMADDLLAAAEEPALEQATDDVDAVRHTL
jgi:hypothetical protein